MSTSEVDVYDGAGASLMIRPDSSEAEPASEPSTGQLDRIAEEVGHLLARVEHGRFAEAVFRGRLKAEKAWWQHAHEGSLLEAVTRSFQVRHLLLRSAESDGTWRNALSYIGDLHPEDDQVCTYDYDRAEVRFKETSPLARPYDWVNGAHLDVSSWYTRNGMCGITAWLIAVARMGAKASQKYCVLTNRLYHETDLLFQMARLQDVEVRVFDDVSQIIDAAASIDMPATIFLDSSRPDGDAAAVRRTLEVVDADKVACVVWDNTCAPAHDHPFDERLRSSDLPVSLILIRSHAKLDQLGLEFTSLGSIVQLTRKDASSAVRHWHTSMKYLLSDAIAVSGACASPATLRLLAALGLPAPQLAVRGNECLRAANILGAAVLIETMHGKKGYRIEENVHRCFVEIHIDDLAAPKPIGGPMTWPIWDDLDEELTQIVKRSADQDIPVWKSASFGFHYTGLSWYASDNPPRPHDCAHTVLRVCFGMHDPAQTQAVARIISSQLMAKEQWRAPE
ncbi:MAG: hypothetical protein AAFN74_22745 [Myxococcota bacterium]